MRKVRNNKVKDIGKAYLLATAQNELVNEANKAIADIGNQHIQITPKMSFEYESDIDSFVVTIDDVVTINTKDGSCGIYLIKQIKDNSIIVVSDVLTEGKKEEEFEILFNAITSMELL